MIPSSFGRHSGEKRVRFFDEYDESPSTSKPEEDAAKYEDDTLSNIAPTEREYSEWEEDDEKWEADEDFDNYWEEEGDDAWGADSKFEKAEDVDETDSESGDTDITYIVSEASFAESEDDAAEGEITSAEENNNSNVLNAARASAIPNMPSTSTLEHIWSQTNEFQTRSNRVCGMVWKVVRETRLSEENKRKALQARYEEQMKAVRARELQQYHGLLAVQQENESLKNDVDILAGELDRLRSRMRDEEIERAAKGINPSGWSL